jgi:MoaA/NifB/PqqE/SkfB family radical SAM enzyme
MMVASIYQTYKRFRTLQTHTITALPLVILMPHSACNCRCVMCDIWKGNHHLRQLTEVDVEALMLSLEELGTKQVLFSGGEALLHPNFFRFCQILKNHGLKITLLSTGMTLKKHAVQLVDAVDELIVSLDGDELTHDQVRNIPGAFSKLAAGVKEIKKCKPGFRVSSRTVIHRMNYLRWPSILETAVDMGLDQASFLPADVSSSAFNREVPWTGSRQSEIALAPEELPLLENTIRDLLVRYADLLERHFIAESVQKLWSIYYYYSALHGKNPFPYKKCNAPWVSAVVEPDGTVRPCFFHDPIGNIHEKTLAGVLNGEKGLKFRKELNMDENETCRRCVCSLYLPPYRMI